LEDVSIMHQHKEEEESKADDDLVKQLEQTQVGE